MARVTGKLADARLLGCIPLLRKTKRDNGTNDQREQSCNLTLNLCLIEGLLIFMSHGSFLRSAWSIALLKWDAKTEPSLESSGNPSSSLVFENYCLRGFSWLWQLLHVCICVTLYIVCTFSCNHEQVTDLLEGMFVWRVWYVEVVGIKLDVKLSWSALWQLSEYISNADYEHYRRGPARSHLHL